MADATTKAIAETLRRWHEAPTAEVIPFPSEAERLRRHSNAWLQKFTRPMPKDGIPFSSSQQGDRQPDPPEAA